jgi:hypothetical protein
MKKLLLAGVSLATIGMISGASAADAYTPVKANPCINGGDPYKNYSCLDPYLGLDFMTRLVSSESAAVTSRLLADHAAEHTPDAVYGVAVWRIDQPRRDAAEFGR